MLRETPDPPVLPDQLVHQECRALREIQDRRGRTDLPALQDPPAVRATQELWEPPARKDREEWASRDLRVRKADRGRKGREATLVRKVRLVLPDPAECRAGRGL